MENRFFIVIRPLQWRNRAKHFEGAEPARFGIFSKPIKEQSSCCNSCLVAYTWVCVCMCERGGDRHRVVKGIKRDKDLEKIFTSLMYSEIRKICKSATRSQLLSKNQPKTFQ